MPQRSCSSWVILTMSGLFADAELNRGLGPRI
jgi:hypothetical protein